jgi:hypothetical protein
MLFLGAGTTFPVSGSLARASPVNHLSPFAHTLVPMLRTAPSSATLFSPPYAGFNVTSQGTFNSVALLPCSKANDGGWGRIGVPLGWHSKPGMFTLKMNVSTSSLCWASGANGTQAGATISTWETISLPINLTGSTAGATVDFNVSYGAHENWSRPTPSHCAYNRSALSNGTYCWAESSYDLQVVTSIEDLTSNTSYCSGGSTGVCYGPVHKEAEKFRAGPLWACYSVPYSTCQSGKANSTRTSFNTTGSVSLSPSSTHKYELRIYVIALVDVELSGWKGSTGSARIDFAGSGLGLRVTSINIW